MAANQSTTLHDFGPAELNQQEVLDTLTEAAAKFVHKVDDHIEIWAASQDWFLEEWGRDTFIALPGLLLSTGRIEDAKASIRYFGKYELDGLIPNRIQPGEAILYNSVDAPMWYLQAIKKTWEASKDQDFLDEMLPIISKIIRGYYEGASYERSGQVFTISMDPEDGLIISPPQATWMDADPSGVGEQIVTPRHGKCVEINALWYANLKWLDELNVDAAIDLKALSKQIKKSFNAKFWNEEEQCLLDVIEGDPHGGAIRPNQVIAISHGENLLSKAKQKQVLKVITNELLTPGGLRTLSPRDSYYRGHYDTLAPMTEKDLSYHQGTVWPWLIGPYCDGLAKTGQKKKIVKAITPLIRFCLESEHQSLPEVFSGNPPHEPGGTRSQAWSVAETLRILMEYDILSDI